MKNNTQKLKELLVQALQNVPNDFSLSEVRAQIRSTILKVEQVEQKRAKREQQQVTNQWPVVAGQVQNPFAVKQAIDAIDEMISSEKKKIEEINTRRKKPDEDDNLQAILG
jgi:hypothetical protein